ncbi:hypothetical protein JH67_03005 [Listeria monocytogenes]|nr:hypothetical protein [Listeria monocytogenes]
MAAETGITRAADLGEVKAIDFVNTFSNSIADLLQIMGVTRKIILNQDQKIVTYKTSVEKKDGNVAEGETIPLSSVKREKDKEYEVSLKKYRKAVTLEAIRRVGKAQALDDTDNLLLYQIQNDVKSDFFTFLNTAPTTQSFSTLQMALSQGWAKTRNLFKEFGSVPVIHFVNSFDVANYVGESSISSGPSTAFGFSLLQNFTGQGSVFIFDDVPQGQVYSTAANNIAWAYQSLSGNDLANEFNLTADQTGFIGMTRGTPRTDNATIETMILTGSKLFAEIPAGVVKTSIVAGA